MNELDNEELERLCKICVENGISIADISAAQLEFASKFAGWEIYDDAAHDLLKNDHLLNDYEKGVKISTLRIELALAQGILETKTEDGTRYIRYVRPKDRER